MSGHGLWSPSALLSSAQGLLIRAHQTCSGGGGILHLIPPLTFKDNDSRQRIRYWFQYTEGFIKICPINRKLWREACTWDKCKETQESNEGGGKAKQELFHVNSKPTQGWNTDPTNTSKRNHHMIPVINNEKIQKRPPHPPKMFLTKMHRFGMQDMSGRHKLHRMHVTHLVAICQKCVV